MDLKGIMLSEINQTEKDDTMIPLKGRVLKKKKRNKKHYIEKELRFVIIRGGSSGRENKKEKDYITRKCKGKVLQIRIKNSLIF